MGSSTASLIVVAILVQCVYFTTCTATYYCGSPDPLQNGKISPQQRTYPIGATVDFICDDGHILVGKKWTVCLVSFRTGRVGWAHPTPVCKPITCPDLDDPEYGSVRIASNIVGGTADYKCNDGFILVGARWRKCQSNGQWGGEAPVCKPITCPDLDDPEYGSVRIASNRVGGTADYKCNDGFTLVGARWRKCQSNGQWGGEAPVCKPITCPDLDDPQYGSVSIASNRVGGTADYKCNDGFTLVGARWRKCQSNGQWGGEAPVCKPITCPDLDDPQYGSVRIGSNRVGGTADYKCNDGFTLIGARRRKCQSNGQWGGEAPVCKPVTCPDLDDPRYGSVSITSNRVGGKAVYECDKGFVLNGQSSRKCQGDGKWSGRAPVCKRVTCPDLEDPQYGSVRVFSNKVGGKARYTCNNGFRLDGNKWRTCQGSGEWSGEAPVCVPITCPDLDDPEYGSVKIISNRVGGRAEYTCDEGFTLRGQSWRKCLGNGRWSGKAPVCIPITCPDLDDPRYGYVRIASNRVGGTADYKCNRGFALVGDKWRKCLISGKWGGAAPVCIRDCGKPPSVKNGWVKADGTTAGSTADYSCARGFVLSGSRWRKCLSNGNWSGKTPVCRRKHY